MEMQCKVKSIEPLVDCIYKVILHLESDISFKAGQYLMVIMDEADKRPFSIASAPSSKQREIELHIGASECNRYAMEVMCRLEEAFEHDTKIQVDIPQGEAYLRESSSPLLLIAGGTGFSYIQSILLEAINQNKQEDIYLYWGTKEIGQLYALEEMQNIARQHSNVHFVPVLESYKEDWQGETGNVLEAIERNFESLLDFKIYIAGRFEMARIAREKFIITKQAKNENFFGDAFSFL